MLTRKPGCFNQRCRAIGTPAVVGCSRQEVPLCEVLDDLRAEGLGRRLRCQRRDRQCRHFPGVMHVYFDSLRRCLRIAGESLEEFIWFYAITTHKSQSQWPICIVVAGRYAECGFRNELGMVADGDFAGREVMRHAWRKAAIDRQCKKSALRDRGRRFTREDLEDGGMKSDQSIREELAALRVELQPIRARIAMLRQNKPRSRLVSS